MAKKLPTAEEFGLMIHGLVGEKVNVTEGAPVSWDEDDGCCGAVYVRTDREKVGAVVLADFPLMVNAGAALTITPAKVAQECIASKNCEGHIAEAFGEILNITANLFNQINKKHIKLHEVHRTKMLAPEEAQTLFRNPGERVDYEVTIPSYGTGRVSLFYPV